MPMVGGKKFPYTEKGVAAASAASRGRGTAMPRRKKATVHDALYAKAPSARSTMPRRKGAGGMRQPMPRRGR
jgi:hypothetical protein